MTKTTVLCRWMCNSIYIKFILGQQILLTSNCKIIFSIWFRSLTVVVSLFLMTTNMRHIKKWRNNFWNFLKLAIEFVNFSKILKSRKVENTFVVPTFSALSGNPVTYYDHILDSEILLELKFSEQKIILFFKIENCDNMEIQASSPIILYYYNHEGHFSWKRNLRFGWNFHRWYIKIK